MSVIIHGTDGVTFNDSTTMASGEQALGGWVNFNASATLAIRGSYNVSSVTDNGTGDYTVNWSTNLSGSPASYAVSFVSERSVNFLGGAIFAVGSVQVKCTTSAFAAADCTFGVVTASKHL